MNGWRWGEELRWRWRSDHDLRQSASHLRYLHRDGSLDEIDWQFLTEIKKISHALEGGIL